MTDREKLELLIEKVEKLEKRANGFRHKANERYWETTNEGAKRYYEGKEMGFGIMETCIQDSLKEFREVSEEN